MVDIDGHELSVEEFGGLLLTREGWGMRISFVPECVYRPIVITKIAAS